MNFDRYIVYSILSMITIPAFIWFQQSLPGVINHVFGGGFLIAHVSLLSWAIYGFMIFFENYAIMILSYSIIERWCVKGKR